MEKASGLGLNSIGRALKRRPKTAARVKDIASKARALGRKDGMREVTAQGNRAARLKGFKKGRLQGLLGGAVAGGAIGSGVNALRKQKEQP